MAVSCYRIIKTQEIYNEFNLLRTGLWKVHCKKGEQSFTVDWYCRSPCMFSKCYQLLHIKNYYIGIIIGNQSPYSDYFLDLMESLRTIKSCNIYADIKVSKSAIPALL